MTGIVSVSDFYLFVTAIITIVTKLIALSNQIASNSKSMMFINYIFEYMQESNTIESKQVKITEKTIHNIRFENVSFKYIGGDYYALKDINISFNTNETICLVGENGSGKSTFSKLLLRIYDPTKGRILLDDIDLREYDITELRKFFGVLFQDYIKFADTVHNSIGFGNIDQIDDNQGIELAAKITGVDKFIEEYKAGYYTNLSKMFFKDAIEPSGGQWQKIAIARAVFSDSSVLVLDEPTAALDPKSEVKMYDTLALTEQCNLRCKYCGYMPKYMDESYTLKEMSSDTAFKAIDILMKNSHESEICHVGFYGGEPLLRLNLIKECVAYIKEKYPFRKPAYNITTNAVLLDEDVAEFLIKNDIKIIISLDGPTQQLNKYRVFQNGKSSFDIVCKNIQMLYRKNPKYFRESVTYNVVMYNGASQELFEAVDSLWKSNVNMIDLFPTDYFMRVRDKSDESLLSAGRINIKSYDFAYKNMLKNMKKYYNSFNGPSGGNKILPGGFCIAGVRKNFVTTDGKIIVCEKVDESQEIFEIGDVDNGIDISKVRRLISYTLKRTEKCKKCWAAKFCKICFKDIININDEFCDKARKDVERELGYYLAQISGDRELINYISNISLI